MFEQATISDANTRGRVWATGLGFAGEAALVGFIVLMPIIWPASLPKAQALLMLLTPPPPVPPAHTTAAKPRSAQAPVARLQFDAIRMPRVIPHDIDMTVEEPPAVVGGIAGLGPAIGDRLGLIDGILGAVRNGPAPPAEVRNPVPPSKTVTPEPRRVRISSLELARLVHRVEPVYPPLAKLAHVSGIVELTAVVGTDGRIRELKALSGSPLLIRAAIDAVSQWIYAPPVLNGERVEVIAPITVNFRMDR